MQGQKWWQSPNLDINPNAQIYGNLDNFKRRSMLHNQSKLLRAGPHFFV